MAERATPAERAVGWFRRLVPIVVGLVGLVFVVVGGFTFATQSWAPASGTVQACTPRTIVSGTRHRTQLTCQVTWTAEGADHRASIDVDEVNLSPGQSIALRVNGDRAREDTPAWAGPATGGLGLALIAVAATVAVRGRRRVA